RRRQPAHPPRRSGRHDHDRRRHRRRRVQRRRPACDERRPLQPAQRLADRGFLIADASNLRVRKVAADGTISTIAGTGVPGFSGDGGDAAAAQVAYPKAVVELPSGEILVADTGNNRLRYIGEPVAPTALSAPRVYGLPSPGRTLRASTGGWLVVPTGTYTYQWQRCDA